MNIGAKRITVLAGGFLMLLALGIVYAWGVFVGPLEKQFGWTRAETSFAFSLLLIGFSMGVMAMGIIVKRLSCRSIIRLAALLMSGGMLLTSMAESIVMLYITYSLAVGMSVGMVYNTAISVVPRWYPEKKGFITGLLLMGYAFSASLLGPLCQLLLNSLGVASTFRVLACINFCVLIACSFIISTPSEDMAARLPQAEHTGAVRSGGRDYTPQQMLRTREFSIYFLLITFWVFVALSYLNHTVPALTGELFLATSSAALVVSAMSICNGVSRPMFGKVYDVIGLRKTFLIVSAVFFLGSVAAVCGLSFGSPALLIAGACISMLGYGGQAALTPTATREVFGEKYFSINYSFMALIGITGSFGPSIIGFIQMIRQSYDMAFLFIAAICLIHVAASFFLVYLRKEQPSA